MKQEIIDPPRKFQVGLEKQIEISHCANISLESNEQITLVTDSETEFDIARKDWGYYATPSTNSRLINYKLRTALVSNTMGHLYVMLCEVGKEDLFYSYLKEEQQQLLIWLDTDDSVKFLKARLD